MCVKPAMLHLIGRKSTNLPFSLASAAIGPDVRCQASGGQKPLSETLVKWIGGERWISRTYKTGR